MHRILNRFHFLFSYRLTISHRSTISVCQLCMKNRTVENASCERIDLFLGSGILLPTTTPNMIVFAPVLQKEEMNDHNLSFFFYPSSPQDWLVKRESLMTYFGGNGWEDQTNWDVSGCLNGTLAWMGLDGWREGFEYCEIRSWGITFDSEVFRGSFIYPQIMTKK